MGVTMGLDEKVNRCVIYSIWDELSGHIGEYSTLQSEVLKNGKA